LAKTQWLLLDPYTRSRIIPGANHTADVSVGLVMQCGDVA
jgi:NADPH-dependent curcumin reductase CurA